MTTFNERTGQDFESEKLGVYGLSLKGKKGKGIVFS